MVEFLRGQITLDESIDQFYEIDSERQAAQQKVVSDFQTLETCEPDVRSVGFARLIDNLFSDIRFL